MDFTIEHATTDHIKGIYLLVEELAIYEKARKELTMTPADYDRAFELNQFKSIVAIMDGTVIGTCIYYDTFSTWKGKMLYLEDFVVSSQYRKHGIGQALYDFLHQIAREEKYSLVKWQVLDWNEPALNFYKKNQAIIETQWWNCKTLL
jgi:Predicted acetyltransferase